MQFIIAWLAQSSTQKGVLWWAAHHRRHHRSSDQPKTPIRRNAASGGRMGWILDEHSEKREDKLIPDLLRFPSSVGWTGGIPSPNCARSHDVVFGRGGAT